ncbi:MAG: 50S ribosomal protein L4 [Candidatus Woesearchaeota archaeon]
MKIPVLSKDGSKKGDVTVPSSYLVPVRKDIIHRAVTAIETNNRQRYGADPEAGMKVSAKLSRRRRDYRGSYGHGISRVPRKIMSRRGTRLNWVAAEAPGTVGGRRAHPPKSEKLFSLKVNVKENKLAIRSALAASFQKELVSARGHVVPDMYPFVVDTSVGTVSQTKDLLSLLKKYGLEGEIARTSNTGIRAGKGKTRGRRKITKRGVLFVTSESSPLRKAVANVPGFDCTPVTHLNASMLAPGGEPGRLVIFTEDALTKLIDDKLYVQNVSSLKTRSKKAKESSSKKEAKSIAKAVKKVASKNETKKVVAKTTDKKTSSESKTPKIN